MTVMNFDLEDGLPRVSLTLRPDDAERFAKFLAECEQAKTKAAKNECNAGWFALVMNAAAELEDAANCLRDQDAKRSAEGAAKHYRTAANAMWAGHAGLSAVAVPLPAPVGRQVSERCHAGKDGDCVDPRCPQLRDGEPAKSGRHCPLDEIDADDSGLDDEGDWCDRCNGDRRDPMTDYLLPCPACQGEQH